MASTLFVDLVTKILASWTNDVDTASYNVLTGVSGTNTIAATGPASLTAYAAGLGFKFIPAVTNNGATTLNITPSGGAALGARNIFLNGVALVAGELVAGRPVLIIDDGTQFNIIGPMKNILGNAATATTAGTVTTGAQPNITSVGGMPVPLTVLTNSIGADVALNNTANYFDGPTVAQGTSGTWFASGTVSVGGTNPSIAVSVKLWDGTTVIASAFVNTHSGVGTATISLSGFITSPAGNIRISVRDGTDTVGSIKFNTTGNSKDSTITAIRIA